MQNNDYFQHVVHCEIMMHLVYLSFDRQNLEFLLLKTLIILIEIINC
jgi:hypothetical protein